LEYGLVDKITVIVHTEFEIGRICVADRVIQALIDAEKLTGPGAKSASSSEKSDLIKSAPSADVKISNGKAEVKMPLLSVVAASFKMA
jgi:hypothetical protein